MIKFHLSRIEDVSIQKNFEILRDFSNKNPFMKGSFRHIEFEVPATGSNLKYRHSLGFTPKDVLLTSQVGGTITFLYNSFDNEFIYFNATVSTSPLTVRAFLGTYSEDVNV